MAMSLLISYATFSQTMVEYTITVTSVTHNFQCGSDGFFSDPEPRWKIRAYHVGGTVPAYTVINLGTDACGTRSRSDLLADFQNSTGGVVCASNFEVDYQSWEEDGCGSDNDFNGGGCANNDENEASAIPTYAFSTYPQNTNTTITINSANGYDFDIELWWREIPAPTDISTTTSGCSGTNADLEVSASVPVTGGDFNWYTVPTGGTPVATGSTYAPVISGSATYYVSYSNGACETARTAINVTEIGSTIPTSINTTNNNFCVGGSIDLTEVGGSLAPGADWVWYEGGCGVGGSIGTGSSVTGITPTGTTTYYVRAEGGSCPPSACTDITITVDQMPTPANAGVDVDVCGLTGVLAASSPAVGSGMWTSYTGPGTADSPTANNSTVSGLSYVTPTELIWTISNGSCPSSTDTVTVTSFDAPSTSNAGTDQTQCDLTTATLNGNVPTTGTGMWTVLAGGGTVTTPTAANSGVTGLTAGTNTFQWEISNGPCTPEVSTVDIVVETSSTDPSNAFAADTVLCAGQSTILQVVGGTLGTGASWNWYSGSVGGTFIGSGTTVSTPPLTSTTDFYVVAEGNCNTTTALVVTVTIGAGALAPSAADFTTNNICPGDTTQVYVTGGPLPAGYTWVWYTGACGAVPVGVGDTIDVAPTATTTYYVSAVGTCGSSLCEQVTVDVQNGSIAPTSVTTDTNNFCPGTTANLTVSGGSLVAGATWTWYQNTCGGTAIGTGSTISVSPTATVAYYVRAEGGTCGNTNCADILINVIDADAYMVPFDTLCGTGATFELTNGLPGGGVYSGTGVVGNNFSPAIAGVGTHIITYDYTSPEGCLTTVMEDITIVPSSVSATAVVTSEPCAEGGVTITVNASGGIGFYDYLWSDGASVNPYNYVPAGTYDVTVIDGSDCYTTITGIVVTDDLECVEVANTFTPNGDGNNDTWNLDFTAYSNVSLQVFSKWGTLVYETNEQTISWDGQYQGEPLPAGTYYYIMKLDDSIDQNGPITIVR